MEQPEALIAEADSHLSVRLGHVLILVGEAHATDPAGLLQQPHRKPRQLLRAAKHRLDQIDVAEVDRTPSPASVRRPLANALGAEHVAINYYELEPGESFAFGYHSHEEQEEVFYVLSGTATFETETGDIQVGPGEVLHVAPGEFQQGFNRGDELVVALARALDADRVGACTGVPGVLDADGRVAATIEREALWQALTPQGFLLGPLSAALGAAAATPGISDEAAAMERAGCRPRLIAGDPGNLKITRPGDLALAEAILASRGGEEGP